VIGDGAMTGGVGLRGDPPGRAALGTPIVVVLNDNGIVDRAERRARWVAVLQPRSA